MISLVTKPYFAGMYTHIFQSRISSCTEWDMYILRFDKYNSTHEATFPPGELNKHYELLLKKDEHLARLSRRPFPTNNRLAELSGWPFPTNDKPKASNVTITSFLVGNWKVYIKMYTHIQKLQLHIQIHLSHFNLWFRNKEIHLLLAEGVLLPRRLDCQIPLCQEEAGVEFSWWGATEDQDGSFVVRYHCHRGCYEP